MPRLPNVRRAVNRWAVSLVVIKNTSTTNDFEPDTNLEKRVVQATVQPAQKNRLNPDKINWSLRYTQLHSVEPVEVGEFFLFKGVVYKIIDDGDWQSYGFTDAVGEEVKDCSIDNGEFNILEEVC